MILVFSILISLAKAQTPTLQAITASGANSTDSTQVKINLLLHLLNDEPYLSESSPDPKMSGYAKFTSTPYVAADKLLTKYSSGSSGGPFAPYDLDSDRSPAEMLAQRIGGECGTHARVFAELLSQIGVPKSDMRIVSAVCDDEYANLCPSGKGSKIDKSYKGGASGHVFVLVKVDGAWKLINTTYSPFDEKNGPNADKVAEVRRLSAAVRSKETSDQAKLKALQVIRGLSAADIEAVPFEDGDKLRDQLDHGIAVSAPEFASLPETLPGQTSPIHFRKMTIFDVSTPDNYVQHSWKDRYNLIASGKKGSDTCRFTLPAIANAEGLHPSAPVNISR